MQVIPHTNACTNNEMKPKINIKINILIIIILTIAIAITPMIIDDRLKPKFSVRKPPNIGPRISPKEQNAVQNPETRL